MSGNFENEDSAKWDYFCNFYAFLKREGASITNFMKGCQFHTMLGIYSLDTGMYKISE